MTNLFQDREVMKEKMISLKEEADTNEKALR